MLLAALTIVALALMSCACFDMFQPQLAYDRYVMDKSDSVVTV